MIRFLRNWFFANTGSPGTRFRQGDHPPQSTFKSLFDSVAFIREKSDTAGLNQQGLAKCTDDTAAANRDSTEGTDQMTKFIKPHQLPNVTDDGGIGVTPVAQNVGRIGGTGKDFKLKNLHAFAAGSYLNLTIIVDSITGIITHTYSIAASFISSLFKIKVSDLDTSPDYLLFKLGTNNPNLTITALPVLGGNQIMQFDFVERVGTVIMFYGNVGAIFTTAAGNSKYCNIPGHVWRGWATCTGDTVNGVVTPDYRGYVPIGYDTSRLGGDPTLGYTTPGVHVDDAGAPGEIRHALSAGELPIHTHAITNGTDNAVFGLPVSAGPDHTHDYTKYNYQNITPMDTAVITGTPNVYCLTRNDSNAPGTFATAAAGSHRHQGTSGDGGASLGGVAHENRMQFTVTVYIMYVGY